MSTVSPILSVAAVERLEADDRLEQGRLADAVRADDADDAVTRQREAEAVDEDAVAEALLELLRLDHLGAEARAGRDHDLLEVELARLLGLGGHLLVAGQTGLRLGLAALRVAAHPLELVRRGAWRAWRPSCPAPAGAAAFFSR